MRNFFFYAHSFLQTPGVVEASEEGFGGGVPGLILRASLPSQVVLLILIVFSIVSWAVILLKLVQFQSVHRQTASFIEVFRRSSKFSEVQSVCKSLAKSPLTGVFQAGYVELNAQLRQPDASTEPTHESDNPTARPTLKSFDALDRALLRASTTEVAKLERRVPFLATTASITPFIGYWGRCGGLSSPSRESVTPVRQVWRSWPRGLPRHSSRRRRDSSPRFRRSTSTTTLRKG